MLQREGDGRGSAALASQFEAIPRTLLMSLLRLKSQPKT